MKELSKLLIKATYPALLSLFLFMYANINLRGEFEEIIPQLTFALTILFFVSFLVGFVMYVICIFKKKKE